MNTRGLKMEQGGWPADAIEVVHGADKECEYRRGGDECFSARRVRGTIIFRGLSISVLCQARIPGGRLCQGIPFKPH
jgi:hypothetical protein